MAELKSTMVINMELQESINRKKLKKLKKLKLYTIVFVVISILSLSIAIYQLIFLSSGIRVSFMYNYMAGTLPTFFASYFIVDGVPYLQYYRSTIRGKIQRGTFGLWTYLNISPAFYYPFLSFVMDNFGQPSLLVYILNIGVPIIMSSVLEFIPIHYWRINRRLKSNIYQH